MALPCRVPQMEVTVYFIFFIYNYAPYIFFLEMVFFRDGIYLVEHLD